MGHSKQHMVDVMNIAIEEMAAALKFAKVKETHLVLHERTLELPVTIIREGFGWLTCVHKTQFATYQKVRALLTTEQWDRYLLWEDFEDFREVIMLRKATFEFRRCIVSRHRPNLFKKGKTNGEIKAIDRKKKAEAKAAKAAAKAKAKANVKEGAVD